MFRFKLVPQNAYEDDAEIDPREGGGILARIKNDNFKAWLITDVQTAVTSELKERLEDGGVHIYIDLSERAGNSIALYSNHLTINMRYGIEHALEVEKALRDASLDLVIAAPSTTPTHQKCVMACWAR